MGQTDIALSLTLAWPPSLTLPCDFHILYRDPSDDRDGVGVDHDAVVDNLRRIKKVKFIVDLSGCEKEKRTDSKSGRNVVNRDGVKIRSSLLSEGKNDGCRGICAMWIE